MTKKSTLTVLLIVMLSFSGCFNFGGSDSSKTTDENATTYTTNAFFINVPKAWDIIEKDDFTMDVPPETQVVFRNNVKNETFTANVIIIQNLIQTPLPSLEYAKMVYNRQSTGLYDFKEINKNVVKIKIGDKEEQTNFLSFEAKKGPSEKLIRYLQTYAVKDNNAYIVTGAISPQENANTVKFVEDIVKSFNLK